MDKRSFFKGPVLRLAGAYGDNYVYPAENNSKYDGPSAGKSTPVHAIDIYFLYDFAAQWTHAVHVDWGYF